MSNLSMIDIAVLGGIAVIGLIILTVLFIALRDVFGTTRANRARNRLLQSGTPAPAIIQRAWEVSHADDATNIVMGFQLQVTPPGAAPFLTDTEASVGMAALHLFQPGALVQVRYDPLDTKTVALEKLLA
jgi:hypothetical protein